MATTNMTQGARPSDETVRARSRRRRSPSPVDAGPAGPAGAHAPDAGQEDTSPRPLEGSMARVIPVVNRALRLLNRWFMVPSLRMGLGPWIGTPMGGYILLLRVRGRRTGRPRMIPLSYLIADGAIWVMAGFGTRTQWYRNLLVDPAVEVWLPGRVVCCRASTPTDAATRAAMLPRLTRAAGVPGVLIGCNPWRTSDDRIVELLTDIPLVRLDPVSGPVAAGPDDPGGHAWIWRQALVGALTARLISLRPRGVRD